MAPDTVRTDERHGNIFLGGSGSDGDLIVEDEAGSDRIHLDGQDGPVSNRVRVYANGSRGRVRVGGDGRPGFISVEDGDGGGSTLASNHVYAPMVSSRFGWFFGDDDRLAEIRMYQPTDPATDESLGSDGYTVKLRSDGTLALGDGSVDGEVFLNDDHDTTRVVLTGGPYHDPHSRTRDRVRVRLDGEEGSLRLGGGASRFGEPEKDVGRAGRLVVTDADGDPSVELDGSTGGVVLTSPNGSRFRLGVTDAGDLTTTPA